MELGKMVHKVADVVIAPIRAVFHVYQVDLNTFEKLLLNDRTQRVAGDLRLAKLAGRATLAKLLDEASCDAKVVALDLNNMRTYVFK